MHYRNLLTNRRTLYLANLFKVFSPSSEIHLGFWVIVTSRRAFRVLHKVQTRERERESALVLDTCSIRRVEEAESSKTEEENRTKHKKKKMPLKMLDATVSSFDNVFEMFKSEAPQHKANLILFLADKDPSTSLSWCPDCVRAEPVIYKKLEASPDDVALLRAYVGDRPTWRNPSHPWRGTDSVFKLTGVPTLIRWEKDTIKGRLEDHEAHLEHKIDALLSGN